MTGYTVHTGTSKKFVSGWDRIFDNRSEEEETATKPKSKKNKKSRKKKKKKDS